MSAHRLRRLAMVTLSLVILCSAGTAATVPLFGKAGVTPQAVRQGSLGSCYFHASIASLAATQPDLLRNSILQDDKGNLSVRFADRKVEKVYPEDIDFARKSRYDLSDGLWVAVLFRGYAQRTLRSALIDSVQKSSLFSPLKALVAGAIDDSDLMLLAYDRAIRSQIDQSGNISRARLKAQLHEEFKAYPAMADWEKRAVELLDSAGFFESLEADIKSNGELFGAYRAVGQGGLPERVFRAFTGSSRTLYPLKDVAQISDEISTALQSHQAVVAWTFETPDPRLLANLREPKTGEPSDWFIGGHAYSVLSIDTKAGTVTVRNPWGSQPSPGGEATISLDSFYAAYIAFSTSTPDHTAAISK